ncbi:Predicted dehydrogenase [Ruaniaceae bacterium KH17]|nr:Predicted dehydrogenase [Ruaniaceae bacterium KH17]
MIGAGGIARAHVEGYLTFPDLCEVVAICDIDREKAENFRSDHGISGARVYDDVESMFQAEQLDLVSISTPPSAHADNTIAAFQAGVNVLVEKPMAPSLEECDRMIAAQEASGLMLSVVAQNRFRDDFAILREALDSGLIGSVSHVAVNSAWSRALPYYDLWWRGTWLSEGGGCTLNHAIHHLDLTLWLLGRPNAVTAVLTNAQHDNAEVEDLSVAILQYDRALAEVTSSVVHHGEDQYVVIQGERARISQPWKAAADSFAPNGFPNGTNDELVAQLDLIAADHVPLAHTSHVGQVEDVLVALAGGRLPAITGQDGRNAVELVTAIYKAGIEHITVPFPLEADDPYYRAGAVIDRAPHFFEKKKSVRRQEGETVVGSISQA